MPVYATVDEYVEYTGEPIRQPDEWAMHAGMGGPVEIPPRIMAKASLAIDKALVGARYDVDEDDMPTDTVLIEALRDATCAQARPMVKHYVHQLGCDDDKKAGKYPMSMSGGLTTEAYDILRSVGLLPVGCLRMRG